MQAVEELRAAGATVVFDESIMPEAFARTATRVATFPYVREGTDNFLKGFGPVPYRSIEDYAKAAPDAPPPSPITGDLESGAVFGDIRIRQRILEDDPEAEANFYGPRRRTLEAYLEPLERLHLDGYVYPAIQMPPVDETMPQYGKLTGGPHSATDWVNMIGVPAVVVVGPFYPGGLPFGLEFSSRPWQDGALLGYAYAYEQATHHRHPPLLVERGLLPNAP
jgi:Asp-tRNA(Asn)/Glu-tRNA(Gln) amidotransferase A subunit family amidase